MRKARVGVSGVIVIATSAFATFVAHAQPFANARTSRSQYSGGNLRPAAQCEQLDARGMADVVELTARAVAAEGNVPQHCRVSGVLAPEIAFEVSLPTPWNGRLYMIGNGGHAGEDLDNPGRAAQRGQALEHGFAMAQPTRATTRARNPRRPSCSRIRRRRSTTPTAPCT